MKQPIYQNYEITEYGEVYSTKKRWKKGKKKLVQFPDKDGYQCVTICSQDGRCTARVHRLVADQYLESPPSERHEIRHLDGDTKNNHYSNLAWGTHQENIDDRERHGKTSRCEHRWNAKLTQDQVDRIRFLRGRVKRGYWAHLARALGVTKTAIYSVLRNKSWNQRMPA